MVYKNLKISTFSCKYLSVHIWIKFHYKTWKHKLKYYYIDVWESQRLNETHKYHKLFDIDEIIMKYNNDRTKCK